MFVLRNFNFILEVDGLQTGFSEVSGIDAKIKPITYREGTFPANTVAKLSGLTEYGDITLKRGITDNMDLFNWINDVANGKVERKTVTLTALSEDRTPIAIWKMIEAWPVSYTVNEFKGDGNEISIETLVLTHEGMTRDQ